MPRGLEPLSERKSLEAFSNSRGALSGPCLEMGEGGKGVLGNLRLGPLVHPVEWQSRWLLWDFRYIF